jgi:hypothetical protein
MSTPYIPDYAIEQRYHTLTPKEFSRQLRKRLEDLPTFSFDELEEGEVYIAESGGRGRLTTPKRRLLEVKRITPKGTQAVCKNILKRRETRLYEGKERRTTFRKNDGVTAQLGQHEHGQIVAHAVKEGETIPPKVRRHYPDLFVEIPDWTSMEAIKDKLTPPAPATTDRLDDWAERTIDRIDSRETQIVENPKAREYHGSVDDARKRRLDLYAWLWDHVGKGGIFHIDE